MMFEIFDHTADLGLRMHADRLEGLFEESARGLFSVIAGNLADVRLQETQTLQVTGQDRVYLLFDWLSELLYVFETRRLLLAEFAVRFDGEGIWGECRGEAFDPARHRLEHEVKAITYHGLLVEPADGGWKAEVIVDI